MEKHSPITSATSNIGYNERHYHHTTQKQHNKITHQCKRPTLWEQKLGIISHRGAYSVGGKRPALFGRTSAPALPLAFLLDHKKAMSCRVVALNGAKNNLIQLTLNLYSLNKKTGSRSLQLQQPKEPAPLQLLDVLTTHERQILSTEGSHGAPPGQKSPLTKSSHGATLGQEPLLTKKPT